MDIKKKIEEIVSKIKNDKGFAAKFKENPIKAVESVVGVNLPTDQVKSIVDGIKSKLKVGKVESELGSAKKKAEGGLDSVKKLFKK